MENIFLISSFVSIIFLVLKFIEMRFIEKENKPLKYLIRDTILVYFSIIVGFHIHQEVNPVLSSNLLQTPVFTGSPDF